MDEPDFGSTTAVYEKAGLGWLPRALRNRVTPATVGSAVAALAICIAYVLNARHDIHNAQNDVNRLRESVAGLEKERELLHKIDTQLAVMNSKIDDIATEVDRQREWRDKIEGVAELPPHARRR